MRSFLFGLIFITSACGRDELSVNLNESPEDQVQLALPEQISGGQVEAHSYLVAFKNMLPARQAHFGSFASAFQAHRQALSQLWSRGASWREARYLSTLDFGDLGRSFARSSRLNPSPWMQEEPLRDERLASLLVIDFTSEEEAAQTLKKWAREGRTWYAEPNFRGRVQDEMEDRLIADFKGNPDTPWLEQIGFVQAIQHMATVAEKSDPPQLIAVLDSGVDVEHPKLKDAMYDNSLGENKLSCRDDRWGCNTVDSKDGQLGDGKVYPSTTTGFGQACPVKGSNCEHGTHVAGIIAGRDSKEFSGICPYCKILVVKVVNPKDFGVTDSAILAGLSYISGFKINGQPAVRLINASIGKYEASRTVGLFIKALRKFGKGTLVFGSAGNEDSMKRAYPAAFEDAIAVANVMSSTEAPEKSPSSNFGVWVDISAPGDGSCQGGSGHGIQSTIPGGGVDCKAGTSMAAPVVTGVAGLILTQEPQLSADEVEQRLFTTANAQFIYADGVNNAYNPKLDGKLVPLLGVGVVNAAAALQPELNEVPTISTHPALRVNSGCGAIGGGSSASALLLWLWPLAFWLRGRRL